MKTNTLAGFALLILTAFSSCCTNKVCHSHRQYICTISKDTTMKHHHRYLIPFQDLKSYRYIIMEQATDNNYTDNIYQQAMIGFERTYVQVVSEKDGKQLMEKGIPVLTHRIVRNCISKNKLNTIFYCLDGKTQKIIAEAVVTDKPEMVPQKLAKEINYLFWVNPKS